MRYVTIADYRGITANLSLPFNVDMGVDPYCFTPAGTLGIAAQQCQVRSVQCVAMQHQPLKMWVVCCKPTFSAADPPSPRSQQSQTYSCIPADFYARKCLPWCCGNLQSPGRKGVPRARQL